MTTLQEFQKCLSKYRIECEVDIQRNPITSDFVLTGYSDNLSSSYTCTVSEQMISDVELDFVCRMVSDWFNGKIEQSQ